MRILAHAARIFIALALIIPAIASSGRDVPSAQAQSIPVNFRVDDTGRFVDTLGIGDLEVLENGVPQSIVGLTLSDHGRILRSEGNPGAVPQGGRHFILYFQMTEYDSKIEEAFEYFFSDVLKEGDDLTVITPQKPYQLTAQAFQAKSRQSLAKEMLKLVRKDIMAGSSEYRSLVNELKRIARNLQGGPGNVGGFEAEGDAATDQMSLDFSLPRYKQVLERVERLRFADESKFLDMAQFLSRATKPTKVIFFYQREFRPTISPDVLAQMIDNNQERPDIGAELTDIFSFYKREFNFDIDRIGQALADAKAPFYALLLNRKVKTSFGIVMAEQSEDMFRIFRAITRTTGGGLDISENPAASLKKIAGLMDPVYTLSYVSSHPVRDGAFRTITVRVKDKPYTVAHISGYFAR